VEKNLIGSELYDFSDIPGSSSWLLVSRIKKGHSNDLKFCIIDEDHQKYFMRLTDPQTYERKKNDFEHLRKLVAIGSMVPEPVSFGPCQHGQYVHFLSRWIHGDAGEQKLLKLPPMFKYNLGTAAGFCLKEAHYYSLVQRSAYAWEQSQLDRWRKIRDLYRRGHSKIACFHKLEGMIENDLKLLAGRPQCLLHGNFTTDNIVLGHNNCLSLIGFNNSRYGDPLHDLASVVTVIRRTCLQYALGVLHCYYPHGIREKSMRLINLYAAIGLVEQVIFAQDTSQSALDAAVENVQVFMRDLQGCRQTMPIWYRQVRATCKKANLTGAADLYVADSEQT